MLFRSNQTYNLDKSLGEQYAIYLRNIARFDFGDSLLRKGTSVISIIKNSFPVTAKLGFVAFCFSMIVGILLGIIAALSKQKWVNNIVMVLATAGVSIPSFLFALMIMIVFGVKLKWFPIIGLKTPMHYVMPTIALSLYPISMVSRLVRSSMLAVVKQDYMVLAKSKGTHQWIII